MTNKGVMINYGDVSPEAKENFVPTASESEFDTLSQLQQYNLNFANYANPCELYQTVLDGMATAFPSVPEQTNVGLWSEQVSRDEGIFAEPIVLTLESEGLYSSSGFTFTFDTFNQIYPTHINIKWYKDDVIILDDEGNEQNKDFYPDNAFYFCENKVEYFNKAIITFTALNMPKNRLKLAVIDYGHGNVFFGEELRNVKLIQETDPISSKISIGTVDFTLDSKSETDYYFQSKQPLSIYFNGELKATTFIKSAKRKAKFLWDIQSEDYIGIMDGVQYYGGIYVNANAKTLLEDIFKTAKVRYKIDDVFAGETVTGYIPFTSCREALMQVCFAIQAVVDTSNSDVVNVMPLDDDINQTIPLERIMQGQKFDDEKTVTSIEVATHSYKPITETVDVYDATESGEGQNIFVKFSEPLHDLSITNGEIVSRGTNYAVINANENCVLTGQKYEHTIQIHRQNNLKVLANEAENVVAIENATLVSKNNIDNVINKCYNWLVNNKTTSLKIVEGKHIIESDYIHYGEKTPAIITYDERVNLGDKITFKTEYLGEITGRVFSQKFNLSGGIIIKDCSVK